MKYTEELNRIGRINQKVLDNSLDEGLIKRAKKAIMDGVEDSQEPGNFLDDIIIEIEKIRKQLEATK